MKKIILALTVALLAVFGAGCVQMHMTSDLKADGSGTMEMKVSLSQVVTESLDELKAMDMGEEMDDLDEFMEMDKAKFEEKLKGKDVKVTKFEKGIVDGRQTFHVTMDFKDVESMAFAMSEFGDSEGLAVMDNGDGTYTLRPYDYGWPEEPEEEAAAEAEQKPMDPAMMGKQMELMGKMMSALAEFQVSLRITVPGDIVASNAHKVEGRTSIWTIDQSNMMSAQGGMEPEITFSAKGLKLKAIKE